MRTLHKGDNDDGDDVNNNNNNNKCTEEKKISSLAKFSIRHQQGNIADLTRNIITVPRE